MAFRRGGRASVIAPDQNCMMMRIEPPQLAGCYVFDPDGLESFQDVRIGGRRGQIIAPVDTTDRNGAPYAWVQWYDDHRAPCWATFEPVDPTWRLFPDRVSWLNATDHLDHDNRPVKDPTT